MNRTLKRRLIVVGAASSLGILSPIWGPMLLRELPAFGVEDTRVLGARFVPVEQIRQLAAFAADASVWDDMSGLELELTSHPLIAAANISRSGLHRVDIEVQELKPVVLVATPVLTPLDASGHVVPIEPSAHDIDLPVLLGGHLSESGRLEPEAARRALDVFERLSSLDAGFARQVSTLRPVGADAVEFYLLPGSSIERVVLPVTNALPAFRRVGSAVGAAEVRGVVQSADARFRDEVVIRYEVGG
jgi:hypothetical protein